MADVLEEMVLVPRSMLMSSRKASERRHVYFVQAVTLGLIKIGVADSAAKRLRGLAMGSPDKLIVLGCFLCERGGKSEGELHAKFAHLRAHGEWFRPDDSLLAWIDDNATHLLTYMLDLQDALDNPNQPPGRKPKASEPQEGWQAKRKRARELGHEIDRRKMIRYYRAKGQPVPSHYLDDASSPISSLQENR